MRLPVAYHIGGVFRCCLESLCETLNEPGEDFNEGDALTCRYCKLETMIVRGGMWRALLKDGQYPDMIEDKEEPREG